MAAWAHSSGYQCQQSLQPLFRSVLTICQVPPILPLPQSMSGPLLSIIRIFLLAACISSSLPSHHAAVTVAPADQPPPVLRIIRGLNDIRALALDRAGTVYAVDSNRIVTFDGQTGALVREYYPTEAGLTFDQPLSLAVFDNGDIFTCYNLCVRMDANSSMVANWTTSDYPNRPPPATLFPNGDILLTDGDSESAVRVDSATRVVTTYNVTGLYHKVQAVAVDSEDNAYIADDAYHVWMFDAYGNLTRMYNLSLPYPILAESLAVDQQGYLYVSGLQGVLKLASNGSIVQELLLRQFGAMGLALDNSGNIYTAYTWRSNITTARETRIVKLDPSGEELQRFTSPYPGLWNPIDVSVDASNNTYVFDDSTVLMIAPNNTVLFRYSPEPPFYTDGYLSTATVDAQNGVVYISTEEFATCQVLRFAPYNNTATLFFSQQVPGGIQSPMCMTVDVAGNVYVCISGTTFSVAKLSSAGELLQTFTTGSTIFAAVAVDAQYNVYLTRSFCSCIVKLDPNNNVLAQYNTSVRGVVVARSGNMYVSLSMWSQPSWISQLSPNGTVLANFSATTPPLSYAWGLALDSDENLYVADLGLSRVVVFASSEQAEVTDASAWRGESVEQ